MKTISPRPEMPIQTIIYLTASCGQWYVVIDGLYLFDPFEFPVLVFNDVV